MTATQCARRYAYVVYFGTASVGCGVDLPPHRAYPRAAIEEASDQGEAGQAETEEGASPNRVQSHVSARGATFRRRHRVHGPFALYGGRIDPGKTRERMRIQEIVFLEALAD